MKKRLIVIFVGMVLSIAALFSEEGRKRKLVVTTSSFKPAKPEGAQGVVTQKASLQSCKPNPFKLSENEIRRLTESAENGDGYACWKLAVYSYLNEKMEIKRLTGIGICLILTKNNKI